MPMLVRNARYVVRSATHVEKDMDLLIEDQHISAVGYDLLNSIEPPENLITIDAHNYAVIPGLINAHAHLYQCFLRGLGDTLDFDGWIQDVMFPFHQWRSVASNNSEIMASAAQIACAEMLKNGTTGFIDMDSTSEASWKVWQNMGIRGMVAYTIVDTGLPPDLERPLSELKAQILERVEDFQRVVDDRSMLSFALAPGTPLMCSQDLLEWTHETCAQYNLSIHSHVAESESGVAEMIRSTGLSPIAWLDEVGLLTRKTSLAHCIHINAEDIQLLGERGTIPVHCPKSNMKLGNGTAPVPEMLAAGVPVALANDGPASNDLLDMFEEMRAAALLQKVQKGAASLTAQEVFRMATENSARACGLNSGTLDPGKLADVVLVNLNQPHLCLDHDIVPLLVYCAKGSDVDHVIVGGRHVVKDGQLAQVNEMEIIQEARELLGQFKAQSYLN